jgi:RNA polymerase sigma-70 factor (ECF subfamily)
VAARRPREVVSAAETRSAFVAFQRAVETGDLQGLLDILAPNVVLLGDGGGVRQAVLRPVVGADRVARLLVNGLGRFAGQVALSAAQVNGHPGMIIRFGDEIDTVVTLRRRGRVGLRALRGAQSREALAYDQRDRATPLTNAPKAAYGRMSGS